VDERLIMFPRGAGPGLYDPMVDIFGGQDRSGGIEHVTSQAPDARYKVMSALDDHSFALGPAAGDTDAGLTDVVGREIVTPTPALYRLWLVWVGAPPGPFNAFATFARKRYAPALAAAP
jgi:hypothetical protein